MFRFFILSEFLIALIIDDHLTNLSFQIFNNTFLY